MTWDAYGITFIFGAGRFDVSYVSLVIFAGVFGAILAIYYLISRFSADRRKDKCQWRRMPEKNSPALTKWRCKSCAVEAFSNDKRPPKECKKSLRPVL